MNHSFDLIGEIQGLILSSDKDWHIAKKSHPHKAQRAGASISKATLSQKRTRLMMGSTCNYRDGLGSHWVTGS